MRPNLLETADSVTSTEEILHGKLYFLCIEPSVQILKAFHQYGIAEKRKMI